MRDSFYSARSRLDQRRFLRPNTHFFAFFEIYKICTPSHRCKFKICGFNFSKICKNLQNCRNRVEIHDFSPNFSQILFGIAGNLRKLA